MRNPSEVFGDDRLPGLLEEAELVRRYRDSGGDTDRLIYLSLGENWSGPPAGLEDALREGVPRYAHGYVLSPYGLPALRERLSNRIAAEHDLPRRPGAHTDYDVAVSQNGTRDAMSDFGRMLRQATAAGASPPAVLVPEPGWDYAGVFEPLGFTVLRYPVSESEGYRPDVETIRRVLHGRRRADPRGTSLLVLNPQHNPTAANWDADTVRAMLRAVEETGSAVLLDDAYFAVHEPDTEPTNALGELLTEAGRTERGSRFPWLAVRTLGKQFHCNGWGVGAMTAHPETLAALARYRHQHAFVSSVPLQAAMAAWLDDPASERCLDRIREEYATRRARVAERLVGELGYAGHPGFPGSCTSYVRLRVPAWLAGDPEPARTYRRRCLDEAGVLLGEGSMTSGSSGADGVLGHVRIYLGVPARELDLALDRIGRAGLGWNRR
ncbi:pyridoxal phosphate-dependent aminotransferase [Actinopolyspora mortivallis]|uniref:Pyridoxal phosphate-dependent aminotransferase n=1 Tax=Actinopolyspora mortivallis TaxID=33906 RepID=A0A2T0GXL1_ACTMO|nr:pyridoxal phosphate-dependent aminotransferase [Actinopolyspora mortivallis]PRW63834.1 pyridoxal phosphate-dependent aminotransferase [Actinopolyspora mortivallis]